jgi:hypothetical protein
VSRQQLEAWIESYERSWRSPGTAHLAELFTADATYSTAPFKPPLRGLDDIERLWEAERDGPDEAFTMRSEIVACEGAVGVARIDVAYGDPVDERYRDIWIIELDADGRCRHFEEWPCWPEGQGS